MALFELGVIVATPGALNALRRSGQTAADFLKRHAFGDWGDVDGHDDKQNWIALRERNRIVSSYQTRLADPIWVITEADRTVTTFLLPSEY
jgi:hypothetical protein